MQKGWVFLISVILAILHRKLPCNRRFLYIVHMMKPEKCSVNSVFKQTQKPIGGHILAHASSNKNKLAKRKRRAENCQDL